MNVCMINDVCSMAEALSKYLPHETRRIERSRDILSKTVGIGAKILAAKADLYHVFYVLQDAYLALRMGKKPIVGHACGSDIRDTLHSKWGWMVKHNLENLDYVLSSQPSIVPQIKEHTDRAEYFPIPIDPQLFATTPLRERNHEPTVFYSSPVDFRVKGADKVFRAVSQLERPVVLMAIKYGRDLERGLGLARELSINVKWIDKIPHDEISAYYQLSDLVLGNFGVGQLDTAVIEAMACGRPVVHHLASGFFSDVPLGSYGSVEQFADTIEALLADRKKTELQVQRQLDYVKIHYADHAVKRLCEIYEEVKAA